MDDGRPNSNWVEMMLEKIETAWCMEIRCEHGWIYLKGVAAHGDKAWLLFQDGACGDRLRMMERVKATW